MATTTNYSWTTPDDTDLVKDGASAIRTLGSSADTTVKNLNPGTTAGDIDYYTSGTAKARVGIGTAGQVLAVNSGATAPEWITAAAGFDPNFALINAGGTALTAATTITVSGISGKKMLYVGIVGASANSFSNFKIRVNADATNLYEWAGLRVTQTSVAGTHSNGLTDFIEGAWMGNTGANIATIFLQINGTNTAGVKPFTLTSYANGTESNQSLAISGSYQGISAITSVSVISTAGNFDAGTIYVYGA